MSPTLVIVGVMIGSVFFFLVSALTLFLSLNAIMRREQSAWPVPATSDIELDVLVAQLETDVAESRDWPVGAIADGITVSSGMLPGVPCRAYRSEVILDASRDEVVTFLADQMVERLPDWNREFLFGQVLSVLELPELGDSDRAWQYQVVYKTPAPLSNREYVYFLARKELSPTVTVIAYQSISDGPVVSVGCVRGLLFRTVHRCEELPDGRTKVEHILANDIGGGFSHWVQNRLLKRELLAANLRDAVNQREIFRKRP